VRPIPPPAVRRLFLPDKGYLLFEPDLKRADAQIVAAESKDGALLKDFRDNVDIYTENAAWTYNIPTENVTRSQYQWHKNGVHGVDYGCKSRTLARTIHCTEQRAQQFLDDWWFCKHPGIKRWHRDTESRLRRTRTVHNVYGFRRYYTDRLDNLLPQALAWTASSAVSITINKGMMAVYNQFPAIHILLQIHDSFLGQVPFHLADQLLPKVIEAMQIEVPYDPPITIPVTLKVSQANWGDIVPWEKWREAA
jgi:DNA polymerase I-like protein with 3'-5' exonuclease and polymerase domains